MMYEAIQLLFKFAHLNVFHIDLSMLRKSFMNPSNVFAKLHLMYSFYNRKLRINFGSKTFAYRKTHEHSSKSVASNLFISAYLIINWNRMKVSSFKLVEVFFGHTSITFLFEFRRATFCVLQPTFYMRHFLLSFHNAWMVPIFLLAN